MDVALVKYELERLQRAAYIMITGAMRQTSTNVFEMILHLPSLGMAVEAAALMAAYRLPRPNPKNLEIGDNRTWAKVDEVRAVRLV